MKEKEVTRIEAIKLIYDRTTGYQIDKMSDKQLSDFLSLIGYGIDPKVPHYGWEFIVKKK